MDQEAWWRKKSEHSLWVTVKQGLSCHTRGTCALHVMWRIAGARSTRKLMAIHPGASRASHSPPRLTALSRREEREQPLHTHPGWEHFMIITIIFPQKIIHRGLCQNWIALPLEHMVQILCGECGESGRMPFWSCSTDRQRLPAFSLSFFLSISLSLCLNLLWPFFSLCFPLVPLITCVVSPATCCLSVLWIESVKFTNGVWLRIHSYKKTTLLCPFTNSY